MGSDYYRKSFFLVWAVISIVILFTLSAPFVLPEEMLNKITPVCQWKANNNRECMLCGMTSGFIDISKGNINGAISHNRASLFLFSLFLINELVIAGYLLTRLGLRKRILSGNQ